MTYLLIALVLFAAGTYYFVKQSDRPGDEGGSAFPALFCGAVSVALAVIYVALVFWNHRFL